MNRASLIQDLKIYKTSYREEKEFISRFQDLLFFEDCFKRSLLAGHITGSAWILDPTKTKVLLMHHKKLDRWLQPGGHADGDEDVLNVAKRELLEETGIESVKHLKIASHDFFDLDIHVIPERKGVPEHYHYDLRFAFVSLLPEELNKNDESNNLLWVELDKINQYVGQERSIHRMREKMSHLL